jgi:hypothetical protein
MEVHRFEAENINVHFWDYNNYKVYEQLYGEFDHGVSIIDLFMNEGPSCNNFLKQLI